MTSMRSPLLEHLSVIAQELSADAAATVAKVLNAAGSPSHLNPSVLPTAPQRVLIKRLKTLWSDEPEVAGGSLAFALRVAQGTAERVSTSEIVELTWTGPRTPEMAVRRNDQALLEVIEAATNELLVASYAVNHVSGVVEALKSASERGVRVRIVLEFYGSHQGDQTFDPLKALGKLPREIAVYEWPWEKRSAFGQTKKVGYLHAKCAVSDRRMAFVSSANLTTFAMDANLEVGILIRGGQVPVRIATNFQQLMSAGILVERRSNSAG